MKLIKKYWAIILGVIVTLFGLLVITNQKKTAKKLKKSDDAIDTNNIEAAKLEGKIEVIEAERVEVKKEIETHHELIENLEIKKSKVSPAVKDTVAAKENILAKTSRRSKSKK
jgi:preprotein translocase subunit YajC